jgi:hypothetical protein
MTAQRALAALRRSVRRRRSDDSGVALVIVVGSMLVLAMFLMVGLTYAISSTKFSRIDQDYTAAMTAAQSGVEDYISRLNRDDNYGRVPDCTNNPAMVNPTDCGGADYGWSPVVPLETDPAAPHFHYSIDASRGYTEGTIMVTSTGRANGVYRTIEVAVGKGGSTDYVYYTDFESADPDNRVAYPSGAPSRACGRDGAPLASYFWQGRSGCQEIQFGTADVLDGRVFSNDAVLSRGGRFLQGIESAYPNCSNVVPGTRSTWNRCLRTGSDYTATGANATFGQAPAYDNLLLLPDNSAAFADYPGCHYYGATRIILNSNGTMTVWSKDSNFTGAVTSVAPDGGTAPSCGSGTALASTAGATVQVPNDMVVYVAGSPTTGPGAVTRRLLYGGEIGGVSGRTLPVHSYSASTPATPTALNQSYTVDKSMLDARKYRGEGNVYLQGVLSGRVTIAAAQSIVVTGDLLLADGLNGGDILGLVATNSVEVMHPRVQTVTSTRQSVSCGRHCTYYVYSWGTPSDGAYPATTWPQRIPDPATGTNNPTTGLQIAGSIQTLQHSFTVQEYNWGRSRSTNGDLAVRGSIAQRWRGAVGTAGSPGTGYNKDYAYDVRLRYTAPPYFPHWVNAQWSLRYSGELPTPAVLKTL